MESESRNLQNEFFNTARRDKALLTIFLTNGKKLVGRLKSFDKFTLLLDSSHGEQMIFKHAVSTVSLASRGGGPSGGRPSSPPARREGGDGESSDD